ncbi:MAG: hypothetical protein H6618_09820 [Deltaproteobacteria bacterium]|nr:hypothetical protein [Deltaproteobacteria bacterium]
MRSHILIFSRSSSSRAEAVRRAPVFRQDKITMVQTMDEFKTLFMKISYRLILIFEEDELEKDLIRFIKSSRSIAFHREVLITVWFSRYSENGIRQALMAGATQIYLNPVSESDVIHDLRTLLDGSEIAVAERTFSSTADIHADIQVYGRVNYLSDQGEYECRLESNILVSRGTVLSMYHRIHSDQSVRESKVIVLQSENKNLFYRYDNALFVNLKDYDRSVVTDQHIARFKTKILWISEQPSVVPHELIAEKSISLYTADFGVDVESLRRINPYVVILHDAMAKVSPHLFEYINQSSDHILVFTSGESPQINSSVRISDKEAPGKYILQYLAKHPDFLTKKTDSGKKLIRRESIFSRYYFNFKVKIKGVSSQHLLIVSPIEIADRSLIRLVAGPGKHHQAFSLYLRTCSVKALESGEFEIQAAVVPMTKRLNYLIPDLVYTDQDKKGGAEYLSVLPVAIRKEKRFRMQMILLILILIFFAGIIWMAPDERIRPTKGPLSTYEEAVKSIRDTFSK